MRFSVFFLLITLSVVSCTPNDQKQNDKHLFIGDWAWEKSNKDNAFSIKIYQKGDSLLGTYCSMFQSGVFMDCGVDSTDVAFIFKATNSKTATFTFQSYNENDIGKASLTYEKGKLIWQLIESPKTERYARQQAILLPIGAKK